MKPEEIAALILEGHLQKKAAITDIPNFRLDLQLNYSGLMAKGAYKKWKERRNAGRKKVGCFDFKIFRLTDSEEIPMRHPRLISDVEKNLELKAVELIFAGEDPMEIGYAEDIMIVLQEVQLAMLEQEINWGDEAFQSWSKFLPSNKKRPRDFVTAYFRRIIEEPNFLENINKITAASGTRETLPPPDGPEWKNYREPRGSSASPWLTGALLERFREAAKNMPDNPDHKKTYA